MRSVSLVQDFSFLVERIMLRVIAIFLVCFFSACFSAASQFPPFPGQESSPRQSAPEIEIKDAPHPRPFVSDFEPNLIEKKLLTPDEKDQQRFADFLQLPNTGMIRLFPDGGQKVIAVKDLGAYPRPGFGRYASSYSFSKKKHGTGLGGYDDQRFIRTELRLSGSLFGTGVASDAWGLLIALGNVPLESVNLETYGVTALTQIVPPDGYPEILLFRRRTNRSAPGLEGLRYGQFLSVAENMTYVMRSTSNQRADLIIAFRVIRKYENGSVTLIWRELKVYPKPSWKKKKRQSLAPQIIGSFQTEVDRNNRKPYSATQP